MPHTSEYNSYACAKQRCTNPNHRQYKHYGGRGIQFKFSNFREFISELGHRPLGMILDRINNDGNYEKGNVRWTTGLLSRRNRRWKLKPADQIVGPSISVRIAKSQCEILRTIAKRRGMMLSVLLNRILARYIGESKKG